jgi:hypothetical protein
MGDFKKIILDLFSFFSMLQTIEVDEHNNFFSSKLK